MVRGGDYLLALKGNRPVLFDDVAAFFADPHADMTLPGYTTTDANHGRIEAGRQNVCHTAEWLFSARR